MIGVQVHGEDHTVGIKASKLAALIKETETVLSKGHATGREMQALTGHWIWAMLVRRPALSIFSAIFKFGRTVKTSAPIWPTVKRELQTAIGIAPLLYSCISAQFFQRLVASDASETGVGVVAAKLPESQLKQCADLLPQLPTDDIASSEVKELISGVTSAVKWRTIVQSRWRWPIEHINLGELRSLHAAVRWAASFPEFRSRKSLFLVDSAVVAAVVSKGRTSSGPLLRRLRPLTALVFAMNARIVVRWIPSAANPADAASRA